MERVFVIKLIDFIFVEGIVCNVNLGLVVSGISCMILMFALVYIVQYHRFCISSMNHVLMPVVPENERKKTLESYSLH